MSIENVRSSFNSTGSTSPVTENGTQLVTSTTDLADSNLFMKLLVAQMSNQDPFNSQDPTQYITQLAQFSMLEQQTQMTKSIETLTAISNGMLVNSALSTATNFLGKTIEYQERSVDSTTEGDTSVKDEILTLSGTVKSVFIEDGVVRLEVETDGEIKEIDFSSVSRIN